MDQIGAARMAQNCHVGLRFGKFSGTNIRIISFFPRKVLSHTPENHLVPYVKEYQENFLTYNPKLFPISLVW